MSVESDLAASLDNGEEVVLATVVRLDGAPPSRLGAKVLMDRSGPRSGTLGCSDFDSAAQADVPLALDAGTPQTRTYIHELGTVEALLEPYPPMPTLAVVSATPVAAHALSWGRSLGFRTVLVESRSERLTADSWPADETLGDPSWLGPVLRGELYAVLTDHDSPDVVPSLRAIMEARPRFVGMMGSRRHTAAHLDALRQQGMTQAQLDRIETPVGIDLGGRQAAEIALSILASVVARRRGGSGGWIDRRDSAMDAAGINR